MRVPSKISLAFDVDDPAFPGVHCRCNPRRLSEHVVSQLKNGETVHLPDFLSFGVYEELTTGDHFPNFLLEEA